jgi:hypothetical protein
VYFLQFWGAKFLLKKQNEVQKLFLEEIGVTYDKKVLPLKHM